MLFAITPIGHEEKPKCQLGHNFSSDSYLLTYSHMGIAAQLAVAVAVAIHQVFLPPAKSSPADRVAGSTPSPPLRRKGGRFTIRGTEARSETMPLERAWPLVSRLGLVHGKRSVLGRDRSNVGRLTIQEWSFC